MIVYRVHFYQHAESSQGFRWFSSEREARSMAHAWKKSVPKRDWPDPTVDKLDCPTHKAGLLEFLNRFASHPDNG